MTINSLALEAINSGLEKHSFFSFFPHIISFILVFGCGGSRRGGRGGGRPPPPPPSGGGGGGGGPVGGKYDFLSVSQFFFLT